MNGSIEFIPDKFLEAIEHNLKLAVNHAGFYGVEQLYQMLTYHMGWPDQARNKSTRGKRIRPLLVLLVCSAAGGDWEDAMPAAVAVELVHNFSLIHDDIQDHSPLRRGRKTVWKKWGIAQAINAGDAMFTLAHLQIIQLHKNITYPATIRAITVLQNACLKLTHGQYLDLAFEKLSDVSFDDYWEMVTGKTAALISACSELGSICAENDENHISDYREFGRLFGLAFQAQDDLLGIWGDEVITGKSIQSDLISGKKTLPIVFGLSLKGDFASYWKQGCKDSKDATILRGLLEKEGGREFTRAKVTDLIAHALSKLDDLNPIGEPGQILKELTSDLCNRKL